ncbi:D-Ala-D-Ala carboxypeptidase family metallohydrolase [Sphingomonas sp. RT2P30]|uniref:D-Ala-D-Ala carboxypeptidase family metallohydrolase n=1 Tax=Parasphingomonas halimpatiens TaxID=3096162 RepID=UPI002FCC0F1D
MDKITDEPLDDLDAGVIALAWIYRAAAQSEGNPTMTTQLSRHFTLEELTRSDTADAHHIANTPLPAHRANMTAFLAPGLEQVREIVGNVPVNVHDAYRCPAVNKMVGGTPTSAHPLGFAADIDVPGQTPLATARLIAAAMKAGKIKIDQLILESGRGTVHVSFDPRARGMMGHQPGVAGTPIDWSFFK